MATAGGESGQQRYDLIVVGGGINGAAIAREAALSGLSVVLFERDDIGGATTAASTRLIHGGLRYLEHAEIRLVYESLHERERLLELAPHLVRPLELALPLYRGAKRGRWQVGLGLTLYDLLAFGSRLPRHRMLGREALRARLPGLAAEGLSGGAVYWDAQVEYPERLVVELVLDAVDNGAALHTHSPVTRVRTENARVTGVEWRDVDGSERFTAGDVVVNAAGPWVDLVLGEHASRPLLGGTKGSHLVVAPFEGAPETAVYTEAQADGRPFFIVPWNGLVLIGTTDLRYEGDPAAAEIDDAEIAYLARETERVFPGARDLAERVRYTYSGVRPLPNVAGRREGAITRDHSIVDHETIANLSSIVGGKLTTHRALAEDTLAHLRARLPRTSRTSPTRTRLLPGAASAAERAALEREIAAELGAVDAARLMRIYGMRARAIADRARASSELGARVAEGSSVRVAELVHALENEAAVGLVDILQRRCMAGLDADFGLDIARAAAERLADLKLWDAARAEHELELYRAHARRARAAGEA